MSVIKFSNGMDIMKMKQQQPRCLASSSSSSSPKRRGHNACLLDCKKIACLFELLFCGLNILFLSLTVVHCIKIFFLYFSLVHTYFFVHLPKCTKQNKKLVYFTFVHVYQCEYAFCVLIKPPADMTPVECQQY